MRNRPWADACRPATGGIIAAIAMQAALDDDPTAHVLRHTFATSLRGKTHLVVVAGLMGHSRPDTTRQYSLPTEQGKTDALNHLTTDH